MRTSLSAQKSQDDRRRGRGSGAFRQAFGVAAVGWLMRALEVAKQRRALMRLDDAALKDIGLSRADAYREGHRHFWDTPSGGQCS